MEVWGGGEGEGGTTPPLRPYWLKVWGRGADWPPRFPPPPKFPSALRSAATAGAAAASAAPGAAAAGSPEPRSGHAGSVGAVLSRAGRCPRQLLGGSVQLEGEVSSGMREAGLSPIPISALIPTSVPIPIPVPWRREPRASPTAESSDFSLPQFPCSNRSPEKLPSAWGGSELPFHICPPLTRAFLHPPLHAVSPLPTAPRLVGRNGC